jgi:subfamily B ATP-binding cassette protein MsbA
MRAPVNASRGGAEAGRPPVGFLTAMRLGFRCMWRRPLLATAFLGSTLVQGVLQGLLIWVLRHVLESFGGDAELTSRVLLIDGLLIFVLWTARAFTTFTAEALSVQLSHRVELASMLEVLSKLLHLPIRFFDRHHQADVVMAAYHDLKGIRAVTLEVGKVVLYLAQLSGLAVAAWTMSPVLAAVGMVAVPLGVLPAYWFGREITEAARGEREAVATLHQSFYQVAVGIRLIRVNRGEPRVLDRARAIARDLHRFLTRQNLGQGFARLLLESVSGLGLILVLTLGGYQVARGELTWQALLGLLVAMMAVYSPIVGLVQLYGRIRSVIPNLDRVEAILREPNEVQDRPNAQPLAAAPAKIELRDVCFAQGKETVLDSLSATFYRGERIGIVGASGAGKTTLVSLLLRFYTPTRGAIYLDDVDLRDIRHHDWMDQTAIVLQEPVLFIDTVANNIRVGCPGASLEQVMNAARAANIHDEIMAMESGYDTLVGIGRDARGVSLGQKQRLCIATALLKNAPILFLDEATSSLDAVSERKVQAAVDLLMEGRTTFVVAHRFSTLRGVDRIVVLDQGRLVGLGTHDELVEKCTVYRSLWESQGSPPLGARPSRHAAGGRAHV